MPKSVRIRAGEVELKAELNDCPTARKIADALPIEGRAQRWGEEIYFAIPVQVEAFGSNVTVTSTGSVTVTS